MSYWSQLEESRRRLTAGDFLEAERLYFEAREEHGKSRLRAPLMEKGVEPLMRGMRRLMGKPAPEEGPAFPRAADSLLKDLKDVAALHENDARRRTQLSSGEIDLDATARLAMALRLQRQSRLFQLQPDEHWEVTQAYLKGCVRHFVAADAKVLDPALALSESQMVWLCGFLIEHLGALDKHLAPAARWLLDALLPLSAVEGGEWQGEALALRCRLYLLLPEGAPAALREGIFALQAVYPPHEVAPLLRLVAGLACNETRLATPTASEETLESLRPLARRFGLRWPPEGLVDLLRARRPASPDQALASLSWEEEEEEEEGRRIVLMQSAGGAPVDLLVLRPVKESTGGDDPFALPMTEARATVDRWLPPGIPLLCESSPAAWLRSLLGDRPVLALAPLETAFPLGETEVAPPGPGASHPLFEPSEDPVAAPWIPLVTRARALAPRLFQLVSSSALSSDWGMRNLEAMGAVGLTIPLALARALRALGAGGRSGASPTETTAGVVALELPSLAERPWPGRARPYIPMDPFDPDVLITGRPSPGELAGCALAALPCVVYARDEEAATELAGHLVGHVDPRRITLAPRRVVCPEAVFALLDDWIEESVADPERSLDVLWLYRILATAADGDLARWLGEGDRPDARTVVEAILEKNESCGENCRLHRGPGCWNEQIQARRRQSEVWVEWAEVLEQPELIAASPSTILCDDLVELIATVEDERALARMDGLLDRAAAAPSLIAWMDAAICAEALVREWSQRLPEGRSFSALTAGDASALSLHLSPGGYAPGCSLLEEESRALIQARAQAWIRRSQPARAWVAPGAAPGVWKDLVGAHPLSGVGKGAHRAVVAALLAAPGPLDRVLALLRLAAAASHSSGEVACVDPRLSEIFGGSWAVAPNAPILTDPSPATKGAELLDRLPQRLVGHWRHPLDAFRLKEAARRLGAGRAPQDSRIGLLAEALSPLQRRGRRVLGSVLHEDRLLLAWTLALLAEESRDGGPLDARFVVWLGEAEPELLDGAPFGTVIAGRQKGAQGRELAAALESGSIRLLVVPPSLLRLSDWRRWLSGLDHCAFLLAEGDRVAKDHPAYLESLASVLDEALSSRRESITLLALFDEADTSATGALTRLSEELGATAGLVGSQPEWEGWRWQRIRLEDPPWYCARCHKEQTLSHPYALCTRCGEALLQNAAEWAAADQALRSSRVRWLSRQGFEHEWLTVTLTAPERDSLLHDLGIVPQGDSVPLLGDSWAVRILTLEELWTQDPPAGELVFTRLPEDPGQLRSALARLRSRGRLHGLLHFMDHPLAWIRPAVAQTERGREIVPSLGDLRWRATRAEVEFRCREALGRVERALRARGPSSGKTHWGLGPVPDPREDPRVSSLARAVALWRESAREGFPEDEVQKRGLKECLRLFDRLAEGGLGFEGKSDAKFHTLAELFSHAAEREAAGHVLLWLLAEGLMEIAGDSTGELRKETRVSGQGSGAHGKMRFSLASRDEASWKGSRIAVVPEKELLRWRDAARSAPSGVPTALAPWPISKVAAETRNDRGEERLAAESDWVLGVAGSGKSFSLQGQATQNNEGPPALVVVANAVGLLQWEENLPPFGRVLCVTLDELILDFLRCHHELGGFTRPPRILSPSLSPEGEDLRRRLLRDVSRRYAVAAGASPPVDLMEMRRVLEGGIGVSMSAAAGGELDTILLQRCAAAARCADNWVLPTELGPLSRRWLIEHPYVGEAWRDRYPTVLVDDVDAMPQEKREFLDRLFPENNRISSADSALLTAGHPRRGDGGERRSRRLPRELARAGEFLLREEIVGRGSIKARGREKGKLLRHHVLSLQACVGQIESALSGQQWQRQRVGVVLAYSGDMPRLASHLRDAEIQVWPARQVLPACVPGPRDFLLALALGGKGADLEPTVAGSLAMALLHIADIDPAHHDPEELGDWIGRLVSKEAPRPRDPAEAFLQPLQQLAPRLQEVESLIEAARCVEATHLMPRVERDEVVSARLSHYVQERAEMPWRGVLIGLDPAGLVDPLAPGPRVWLLEADDLAALELDRVFYLCTGHEPAELHYRVLGRVRESLTVLYSERDPFAARG